MAKYYVPSLGACYVVNSSYIRVYQTTPRQNSSSNYNDYYFNSHYVNTRGTQTWGTTSTLPTCSTDTFTTNVFYRFDIDSILLTTFILLLICFYFPYRIISRLFGRWLKI